jgi:hypothetical protein
MKKTIKRIAQGLLVVFILFIGLFVVPYFANIVMPWQRADAIEAALEWGGLSGLPETANMISVDTRGSMFTREFIIEFDCEQAELKNWILQSELGKLIPIKEEDGIKVYQVPGQKGSIGGKVYVDTNKSYVIIDMSWS